MSDVKYQFKGTPGPWHPIDYAGHINIQTAPFYGELDLLDADNVGHEIMTANGHLACAAPELLEACIKSLEVFKQLADAGRYPEPLLAVNGGEGLKYLVTAIHKALNL